MHKIKYGFVLFLIIFCCKVSAQKTEIYQYQNLEYDQAVALYNQSQYLSSQLIFEKLKSQYTDFEMQSNCSYFIAFCAIKLDQINADDLMENFVSDYPTSTKKNQAYVGVASFYFEKGNYPKATEYFSKIDESNLDFEELEKIYFQKGYAFFTTNNKKEATVCFNKVINSAAFGSQAKYYLGFMAYENNDYKEANKQFEPIQQDNKFKEKLSYFQADMNFKLGNFKKAIDLGQAALSKSNAIEVSELNKIIGESHFNLKQYDAALPYLQAYKGKNGKWNNTDFYQLGYALYKQKDYENAVSQFNKIINGNDFVAQNAFYHLGESYLKLNRKPEALNAFKGASEFEFDKKIQEDATLNYAKLSYEIGNSYKTVPEILNSFLVKYPNTASKNEVETLLINSYITSKNYKEALILLDKNKFPENRLAFQKVTFLRGLEFFADGNYSDAKKMFEKSISEPRDAKFLAKANFWKGETEYILNDFETAVKNYKQAESNPEIKNLNEIKSLNYNLGYAYFKQKQYDLAAGYFQKQIDLNTTDKIRLNDSYLRLGDCLFVSSKYELGFSAYSKAVDLKGIDADYGQFQKAVSLGFLSKNDKKVAELNDFLNRFKISQYRDDALFELGNTYATLKKSDLAVSTYDQLISEFSLGFYTSKAILKQGLIFYNDQKDEAALIKFKKVAADFPKSPEALEAVATARLIYLDNGKIDEYSDWVKSLNFIQVSDAELDNDSFEAAEKQYLGGNKKSSLSNLSSYVLKFPNGLNALKANFYLAQANFSEGLEAKSIANYSYVISKPKNEFTEQSLARLCEIHLKTNDFVKAIPVLQRLEIEADFPQNKTYAQANLMRAFYDQKDYASAVLYSEKVLLNPKTDAKVKADAQIIIARSAFKTNDDAKAKSAYFNLQKTAKGELAAEALYYDAFYKNKENKLAESNKVVQKLARDYSAYKYFGAKGLVIMAKNYYGLKDAFQATSILESVIDNFANFQDIVEEAKIELEKIKTEEAKTNSSISK